MKKIANIVQVVIDNDKYMLIGNFLNNMRTHDPLTISSFNAPIQINIPEENNMCVNWNDHCNWKNHIEIKINEIRINFSSIENWLHYSQINEDFLIATGIEFDSEYFKVKEFYRQLIRIIPQIVKDLIGNYNLRDFKAKIML